MSIFTLTSPAFEDGGWFPIRNTGFGEDLSPELHIHGVSEKAKSIAVVFDDLDIPGLEEYNHWVMWNFPVPKGAVDVIIPEGIPAGETVKELGGIMQGVGFGNHKYRGPRPPVLVRKKHEYRFTVYTLDCFLDLKAKAEKFDLTKAMENHVRQIGELRGFFQRGHKE